MTLIVGLAVTAALSAISENQYTSNEQRLLTLRARDAAAVVTAEVPTIQTALGSAAELADATGGSRAKFERFMAPYVGTGAGRIFVSASLWRLRAPRRGPLAVVGTAPKLTASPGRAQSFFAHAAHTPQLAVLGMLGGSQPRIGYEYNTASLPGGFAAYGEGALPADRQSRIQRTSAFAGLEYALYLGSRARPQDLLLASRSRLPLTGDMAVQTIPFGDTALTLVLASRGSLDGSLPRILPWAVGVLGVLISAVAAVGVLRLVQRRRNAERLAARLEVTANENRRLYAEQRNIAQTLQHALLPDRLPQLPGITVSATYRPGEQGVDIGGDWYDVLQIGAERLLLVVGDVSGRGLRAATTMASLRYAIRAYAAQDDPPEEILHKLSRLLSVADSGQLATILCAVVDPAARRVMLATAGHLPPLLIDDGDSRYLESVIGLPIGFEAGAEYTATEIAIPPSATLIAFTDGLVERRGETLDDGLRRLQSAVAHRRLGLSELLDALVVELPPGPSEDDVAIVGLTWTTNGS